MATSGQFSLALAMGGEVYAWGYGGEGQLGQGDESSRAAPTLVEVRGRGRGRGKVRVGAPTLIEELPHTEP